MKLAGCPTLRRAPRVARLTLTRLWRLSWRQTWAGRDAWPIRRGWWRWVPFEGDVLAGTLRQDFSGDSGGKIGGRFQNRVNLSEDLRG